MHIYVAGTVDSVLIKGASSFQGYMHIYVAGTVDSVLIKGDAHVSGAHLCS